jgi:hypothetical protein
MVTTISAKSQPQKKRRCSTPLPCFSRSNNDVEKRYRSNLNRSIATLRDSVPSIPRNLNPKIPLHVNKATIIDEAVKYIKTLEQCEKGLKDENSNMKSQLLPYQTTTARTHADETLTADTSTANIESSVSDSLTIWL